MEWNNRVTQLLGTRYPIMLGAYEGFGKSTIAAPVSEAGGLGVITAHAFRTPEKLRNDIRRARSQTDRPLGVNLSVGLVTDIDRMLDVVLDERIPVVETSVSNAGQYGERIKAAGAKWIHKVASTRHALAAENQGADAVIIVGIEGVGFKHPSQLPTMTAVAWTARQLKIPVIAAGGIGDAHTLAAALCLGAQGVCMGTAFMATVECRVTASRKQALVEATPDDPAYRELALSAPDPAAYEDVMKERAHLPREQWLRRLEKVMLRQSPDAPWKLKQMAKGSLAVAFVDRIMTVSELMETIVHGAEEILTRRVSRQLT